MTYIVAIAGGSCAGKTTIARALAERLPPRVALIAEDDYYHCRTSIAAFDLATHDFDAPAAKDHALLAAHLALARGGAGFEKPLYDFAEHRRRAEIETVPPADILVLEGMHAFAVEPLRALIDCAVYVEAEEAERLARRLKRDVKLRGRTSESVIAQFERHVRPGHERWVAPQKARADIVLLSTGAAGEAEAHACALAEALLLELR